MTTKEFVWHPATVEMPANPDAPMLIVDGCIYESEGPDGLGAAFAWVDSGDNRQWTVESVEALSANEFRFISAASGQPVTMRPTVPSDAVTAINFHQTYDLPVEIIGAIMASTIPADTAVSAAVDNEGDVHTLILETRLGLYARYSRTWHLLTDTTPIEGLNIVDVQPEDVDAYDEADTAGNMLSVSDLHAGDTSAIEVVPEPEEPEPVTAAAGPTNAVIIASLDDVARAIGFAATPAGESSRWYVARRARALGWPDPMPWEEGQ